MNERPIPPAPGAGAGEARLASMLRVDHAGEVAAVWIYRGHRAVFEAGGRDEAARRMADFETHEATHLARFEALLTERRVRPTLMSPVWRAAAFGLGVGTALMGEKAAEACTEAVESVIEAHYARQIVELDGRDDALAGELAGFRADELAHRDDARRHGAGQAPLHGLLSAVVGAGCRAAIKISERL